MFFDLTLAILALVVIFALGCIMLEQTAQTSDKTPLGRQSIEDLGEDLKKTLTKKVITGVEEYSGKTY